MELPIVVNRRKEEYDIYIGRGSKWGNPYTHLTGPTKAQFHAPTRAAAIQKYREHVLAQPDLLAALPELAGKRLGCYCKPLACHGDVLVELFQERHAVHRGDPTSDTR